MKWRQPMTRRGVNARQPSPPSDMLESATVLDSTAVTAATWHLGVGETASVVDAVSVGSAPPGNWTARSTGAGVVWSHNFTSAAEITAFAFPAPGGAISAGPAIDPFQVTDAVTGHAMRFVAFGARLTADFLASGGVGPRALQIDDDTYWPDPATAGSYYVHLCKPQVDQLNNLVQVTAKSGKTLTVTYIPQTGQPFQSTQRDWLVGDHLGHQAQTTWYRLFSALKGDSNGRGVDDINNAGKTLRSVNDQTNFPHGAQAFGYGWYGQPTYQSTFSTWRPSDYGTGAIDSILRSNMWDGQEFYLQWREKIDPRFLPLNQVAYNNDNRFGRKIWVLQSQMTVPQQVTGGYSPGATRFNIPSTPEPPFAMNGYAPSGGGLAGRVLTENLDSTGSYQTGGVYAATAIRSVADQPAGAAWEIPSGEWVTFMLHVIPGLHWDFASNPSASGVRNTTIEMWGAREADSSFTLLFSSSTQATVYGSSGPTENTWFSALPGYNAIGLLGYLNIELGSVPPSAAYYCDFSEVIFSTQAIACPLPNTPTVWGFTVPASGHIGAISSNTLSSLTADGNELFVQNKVLGDWGTTGVSKTKVGAQVTDFDYLIFGGGHGDASFSGIYGFKASTGLLSKVDPPTAAEIAGGFDPVLVDGGSTPLDALHGENEVANRPSSQHPYQHLVGLDSDEPNGPALMQLYGAAVGRGALKSGQAHRFDLNTKTWARFADVAATAVSEPAAIIKDTSRRIFVRYPSDNLTSFYTLDYTQASPTWQARTQAARGGNWSATFEACGVYDPGRDLYIVGIMRGIGSNFCAVNASTPGSKFAELNFAVNPVYTSIITAPGAQGAGTYGAALMYRKASDTFLMVDTSTSPPTGIFELTPPPFNDPFGGAWTWTRRAFTGTSHYVNVSANTGEFFNRFQYIDALDAVIACPSATQPMECWKL